MQKEYILHKKKLRRQKQSNLDLFCGNCSNIELLRTMNHRLPVQSLKYRWYGAPPPQKKKDKQFEISTTRDNYCPCQVECRLLSKFYEIPYMVAVF